MKISRFTEGDCYDKNGLYEPELTSTRMGWASSNLVLLDRKKALAVLNRGTSNTSGMTTIV